MVEATLSTGPYQEASPQCSIDVSISSAMLAQYKPSLLLTPYIH